MILAELTLRLMCRTWPFLAAGGYHSPYPDLLGIHGYGHSGGWRLGSGWSGSRGAVTGLVVDDTGFEVLAGEQRIGPRRVIQPDDVELLTGLARRYVRAVQAGSRPEEFIAIGRELFTWLDGDSGQLTRLLEKAERPLVFEVQGPRTPSGQAWAVLRAPFELLARPVSGPAAESVGGFLAEDAIIRFCRTAARRADDTSAA
jgi:hypothetical protein